MSREFQFLLILLLSVGCAEFKVGRTYLAEMEHDDSKFFEPNHDFPVVAGDNGEFWMNEDERRQRTPASEEYYMEDRQARLLRQELQELEGSQSEESLAIYNQYKKQFGTTSERIFYLKLPPGERRDYLLGRGFISEPKVPGFTAQDRLFAVKTQDIILGMTKGDVLESWGKPVRVEIAGNPRYENERWLYRPNGTAKFIYFESGQVQGWE